MGFLALDYYFKRHKLEWNTKPQFEAVWGRSDDVLFIKPQGFYNETGRVVARWMRYYKITTADILVVCDNFDLKFGKVRFRSTGTAGGNNGLKSLDAALESSDYPRIRVGTGNDELRAKLGDIEFVLSKFTTEEKGMLPKILEETAQKIEEMI